MISGVERVVERCVFGAAPVQPKKGNQTSCYHQGHDGNNITRAFFYLSRGYPMSMYGGRLFVVSARTNTRHHHHHREASVLREQRNRRCVCGTTIFCSTDQVVSYARESMRL